MAVAEQSFSANDEELFGFRVMIVSSAGYARMGGKKTELATIGGFQHFDKYATHVTMRRNVVDKPFRRQGADISRIERSREPDAHAFGAKAVTSGFKRHDLLR